MVIPLLWGSYLWGVGTGERPIRRGWIPQWGVRGGMVYPRPRYEGGGWVGTGTGVGLPHPHQARFPFVTSRPRHTPMRHTQSSPTPLKAPSTPPRNTPITHFQHTKPH